MTHRERGRTLTPKTMDSLHDGRGLVDVVDFCTDEAMENLSHAQEVGEMAHRERGERTLNPKTMDSLHDGRGLDVVYILQRWSHGICHMHKRGK
jgi:hypothetical protein